MSINNFFSDNVVLPVADLLLGLSVGTEMEKIEKFQWQERKYIDEYQNLKFKELVNYIYSNVPFYKKYFAEKKITPKDFVTLKDIDKLPIITKRILKQHFNILKVENFHQKTYKMKSSGSTGTQTVVLVDNMINSEVFATQLLFWSWGGFTMGTPHIQTGMSINRGTLKKIKDIIFRCEYTSAFDLSDAKLLLLLAKMRKKKIKYLFGYASSIYVIAQYMKTKNIQYSLLRIFTWGDCLYPHYRSLIEETFKCSVHDCYGLGEGLQVAAQCGHGLPLHISEHNVFVEIINPKPEHITNDELGKILVTRFTPGPMPLIRYETGDLAKFVSGECSCGRKLKKISRVYGRDTDVVQSPNGDRLIVHFFTQIFEMIPEIQQFQVRQLVKEEIEIFYIPGEGFSAIVLEKVKKAIHSQSTYKFKIIFYEVHDIPLQKSNKRRFVISEIPFE